MKRNYQQPSTEMVKTEILSMICASENVTTKDGNIGYGGVDDEGKKDPATRRFDVWEEDEEEV